MKRIFGCLLLTLTTICASSQNDSTVVALHQALNNTTNDTSRVWALHNIAMHYYYANPDSILIYAKKVYDLSKQIKYTRGEVRGLNDLANAYMHFGIYAKGMEYLMQALQLAEKADDPQMKSTTFGNISENYNERGEHQLAIDYTRKSLSIDVQTNDSAFIFYDYVNLGDYYEKLGKLDSALAFQSLAYQLALKRADAGMLESTLGAIGDVHAKLGNDDLAWPFLRRSLALSSSRGTFIMSSRASNSIAELHIRANNIDSAIFYAENAYEASKSAGYAKGMLDASSKLAKLYEKQNNPTRSLGYLKKSVALNDSIFAAQKVKELQAITFAENMRQQEIEELRLKQAEDRKHNLQLLAIGLFIPVFFLIVLYLSRRRIRPRTVEFLGLLGLLLLFEFISLFLHPHIINWTHNSPIFMIIILVLVASLLVPMHHRMENWIKRKLGRRLMTGRQHQ